MHADALSKIDMKYEYGVNGKTFKRIDDWYTNLTGSALQIDVFASYERHQLPRFFSRYECNGSEGNAFTSTWPNNFYCHAPIVVLMEAFHLATSSGRQGVFVIPDYKSEFWYQQCIASATKILDLGSMKAVLESHDDTISPETSLLVLYFGSTTNSASKAN
jgi:hypothetical protein